jgi:hypothetical protein
MIMANTYLIRDTVGGLGRAFWNPGSFRPKGYMKTELFVRNPIAGAPKLHFA